MASRKTNKRDSLNPFHESFYNPYKTRPIPLYPPSSLYPPFSIPKSQPSQRQDRQHEFIELDLGSGVLWCKFCARSKCPCFSDGGKEASLDLLKKVTDRATERVVIDLFNPEHRFVSGSVLLSHVGCVSFSNVDVSHNKESNQYTENPDFLEII